MADEPATGFEAVVIEPRAEAAAQTLDPRREPSVSSRVSSVFAAEHSWSCSVFGFTFSFLSSPTLGSSRRLGGPHMNAHNKKLFAAPFSLVRAFRFSQKCLWQATHEPPDFAHLCRPTRLAAPLPWKCWRLLSLASWKSYRGKTY